MRIRIDTQGPVASSAVAYAQKKIKRLHRLGESIVDVHLAQRAAPAISPPAVAYARLTWRGRFLETRATGTTIYGAIDHLHEQLRRQLTHASHMHDQPRRHSHVGGG